MPYLVALWNWITSPDALELAGAVMVVATAVHSLCLLLAKLPKVGPFFARMADWSGILAADIGKLVGKLSPSTAAKATTIALVGLLSIGCAGSFEEARVAGAGPGLKVTPITPHCESLDSQHRTWGGSAKFAGALAGVSGLTTIPVDDKNARIALASGAAAAGALAVTSVFVSEDAASSFVRDCQ